MESEDAFKLMPKELTELILSELEPADLARSSGVSQYWRKLASNDLLWRKFFNDYQNVKEPLKIVYGNRKVNWMKRNYKLSIMPHPHGTFYIARPFPGSNVLYTGCLSDVMEEWDMEKAEKICEYEVPTGPASNYRMDETHCVIERENSLKRWKRHKQAESSGVNETFDWVWENPSDEQRWIKYFQAYQFVRERCVMATVNEDGVLIVQLHDMDQNKCLWRHEIKVIDVQRDAEGNLDMQMPRLEWDSLCMSYDLATVVYQNSVIVLDLNKHDVKHHMREDVDKDHFTVCAMHKDTLLASSSLKTNFYSLKDGELLFTVALEAPAAHFHAANMGWAKLDGEKAIVCSSNKAFLIDMQNQSFIGKLEWDKVSRGWTQDMAMNDDFFAVLATDEVVLFDFRKRSKEQELKDAEELKRMEEEHIKYLEEERERQAKLAEEEEQRWRQYRLEHPEEYPDHDHYDSTSVLSEEQPIIPPSTDVTDDTEEAPRRVQHRAPRFRGEQRGGRWEHNSSSDEEQTWWNENQDEISTPPRSNWGRRSDSSSVDEDRTPPLVESPRLEETTRKTGSDRGNWGSRLDDAEAIEERSRSSDEEQKEESDV